MRLSSILFVCVVVLAGCASTQPGWRGTDATPFDRAEADCKQRAAGKPAVFEQCMSRHGWLRD